jgi:solute carrier family 40 (iron-regulated transporter), member 1
LEVLIARRGVLTNMSTFIFSPAIGRWVDRNSVRFNTIQRTIVLQRMSIIAACFLWIGLFVADPADPAPSSFGEATPSAGSLTRNKNLVISVVVFFGIVERMCAVGNQFVMERDWVPTLASETTRPKLHVLNATMRRIDLISKIVAPVFVSVIALRCSSAVLAGVIAALNAVTVAVEVVTARMAWDRCQVLKMERGDSKAGGDGDVRDGVVVLESNPHEQGLKLFFGSDVCLGEFSHFS